MIISHGLSNDNHDGDDEDDDDDDGVEAKVAGSEACNRHRQRKRHKLAISCWPKWHLF